MTTEPTEPIEVDDTNAGERTDEIVESIRAALGGLRESATVEKAYGDPITSEGKTVVPVARVAYGFGVGFGSSPDPDADGDGEEGGGGGGGVVTQPIGALEITRDETRFVRFTDRKRLALAVGLGVVLGVLLGRR